MQKKMGQMQEELAEKDFEASVGGGKVTVVANGAGEVSSINRFGRYDINKWPKR